MDGFEQNENIMVIAATNHADRLDPALVREGRFDRKVYVALPSDQGRKDLLLYYMNNVVCDPSSVQEDVAEELARRCKGFNGAGLKTLVNEAAILSVRDKRETVSRKDFIKAY